MDRRQLLGVLTASSLASLHAQTSSPNMSFLELKVWRLHNSAESQVTRVTDFLQSGLKPALEQAGAQLAGVFANEVGPHGPSITTLSEYSSLEAMQNCLDKLESNEAYQHEQEKLSVGGGLPFVRIESRLLRSFRTMPRVVLPNDVESRPNRIFELRTYESQTLTSLQRKVRMFNGGEIGIFQRLGMRPVFFGETIVGPTQPDLTYMLSFDNLGERERLWHSFASDPEWKKLSSPPELHDSEIVENISNIFLRPLPFSPIR